MAKLMLLRHGQSEWNKKNLFTGWIDIPLSQEGIDEAIRAGEEIKEISIERIYTSTLVRGMMTVMLCMLSHHSGKVPVVVHPEEWYHMCDAQAQSHLIPVISAWELNERMYGKLQGKDKNQMRREYGEEQVKIWRRSFAAPPPEGESLKMTAERTIPYFKQEILPRLKKGENILVVAHGNSLRSIVMEIEKLNEEEVLNLEIPTGKTLYYTF